MARFSVPRRRFGAAHAPYPNRRRAASARHHPDRPVVAFIEVHNRASRAVIERLGMGPAGLVAGRPRMRPDAPFALYRI